ncbi:MAG: aldose epimerase family protein [Sphingobacteriaceae bacterium]
MKSTPLPEKEKFDQLLDGKRVKLYTLKNDSGMEVAITNYGGRIVSLFVSDIENCNTDVTLGFDTLQKYLDSSTYYGALIGRFGNRIANGNFVLDGVTYQLAANNGENALHGGIKGFDAVVWDVLQADDQHLKLHYLSVDGEEGYPGNLKITATYSLSAQNELGIHYEVVTDKKTVLNVTNHAFFNLNGESSGLINKHQLQINAEFITPVNENLIPTGEILPVDGTPFDFRKITEIGLRMDANDQQIKFGRGYDHNYVLGQAKSELMLAATVFGDQSGIRMAVYTDQPGMQFYSGNFISGKDLGKSNVVYEKRSGFCLETQHFPDSPNQPGFPSTELTPGEHFESTTVYKFDLHK